MTSHSEILGPLEKKILPSMNSITIPDIVYGRKFGTSLTMDVFQPAGGIH